MVPVPILIDPSGKFAYASNENSNDVSAYSINPTTGALSALPAVMTRGGSVAMAMTQGTAVVTYTPKFAYAANYGPSNGVSAFTINPATGALTQVNTDVRGALGPCHHGSSLGQVRLPDPGDPVRNTHRQCLYLHGRRDDRSLDQHGGARSGRKQSCRHRR